MGERNYHRKPIRDFVFMEIIKKFIPTTNRSYQREEWKPLPPPISNKYEISSFGRVRYSSGGKVNYCITYIKGNDVFVKLFGSNSRENEYLVFKLMLISFFDSYYDGCRVRFKDGNRQNISLGNVKFTKPKSVYISDDKDSIDKWKCQSKANNSNARYRTKTLEKITKHDVYRVLQIMSFKCFYCDDALDCNTWQIDHFTPVSKGGSNNFKNLACSCEKCNTMKGTMDGHQFFSLIDKIYNSAAFKNRFNANN